MLASMLIAGETDQDGVYSSPPFAPGKYYVLATSAPIDATVEAIGRLWRGRNRAKEVAIGPDATAQVKLDIAW